MTRPPAQKIGNYELLERFALGGMAEVFLARAAGFERLLAVKRLLPKFALDDDFVQMFVDEARVLALLNHPDIVQVFDFGCEGDELFLATEFVPGRDLMAVHRRCGQAMVKLPLWLSVHVGARVAGALAYAHERRDFDGRPLQLVHRDVSTQNVLLSWQGEVKLIDFGIAKFAARNVESTGAGVLKGKFSFMSPEQAAGAAVDHRTDVYATGAVLYHLLCGRSHNPGRSDIEKMQFALEPRFPPPRALNSEISAALEAAVLAAMAPQPDRRLQSARELQRALLEALPLACDPEVPERAAAFLDRLFDAERAEELRRFDALARSGSGPPPQAPAASHPELVLRYEPEPLERITDLTDASQGAGALEEMTTEPSGVPVHSGVVTAPARPVRGPANSSAVSGAVNVQVALLEAPQAPSDAEGEPAPPLEGNERRAFTRLPASLQVSHRDAGGLAVDASRDISFGGLALASGRLLLPGVEREFTLSREAGGQEVAFVGEVANVRAVDAPLPYLTGIRIVRMSDEARARYEALLLAQLSSLGAQGERALLRVDALAFWKQPGTAPAASGRVLEVGRQGAQLLLDSPEAPGGQGLLTLASPTDGKLTTLPAAVTWTRRRAEGWYAGVRFAQSAEATQLVDELLRSAVVSPLAPPAPRAPAATLRVGNYACKTPTHVGAHSVVFSGVAVGGAAPGRRVALKRLRREVVPLSAQALFDDEARFLLGLDHPVAAATLAALRFGDERWQVSEWVDGRSFGQVLAAYRRARRHPNGPAVLSLMAEVGRLFAHRAAMARAVGAPGGGLAFKPSDLVITRDGRVKVVTFGRLEWAALAATPHARAVGPTVHTAPEAWREGDGEAGYVFVLASLIHEALAGAPPFPTGSMARLREAVKERPPPLKKANPEVPQGLEAVLARALHERPRKRPQRLAELLDELARAWPFPAGEKGLTARAELADLTSV